ncbi:hypothetical protein SUGI_0087450 [Cryptomeria japonica]|nr:hypothetical protein SUGI_0087450 [Cryptomeria japonica]
MSCRVESMASTSTSDCQSEIETTNAFDEIAPPSTSASATSSSTIKKPPCSVFINHRGPDVKETLAKAIYHALYVRGIAAFLDSEELDLGDKIPAALQKEMSSASLHVAIFSTGYADSPWCLAELSFMLTTGTPIIPVFYRVEPTDLRWVEKGKYADAFSKHQEKDRYSPEKIKEWKEALQEVSYYKGEIINTNDEEREKLKNVVNRVLKMMKESLSVEKYPVGLENAVMNLEKFVQESGNERSKVQIIGIWGMGGAGKTTLAKKFYNEKCSNVDSSSFVHNIRNAAAKNELHKKQKILLKDLGVANIPDFDDIEKGMEILSSRLRSICVLIILDDVDSLTQLDALLPMKDSLKRDSLILVTTRESEVLKHWSISSIYKIEPMDPIYAKELFCWHAFLQPSPSSGFEELATKFTKSCNGLPLSLKVLGSQLYCHSSKEVWEDLWNKISKILPRDIKNKLRVSYDALDDEEKQMFLDVACFFIGEDYMKAIVVWQESDWSGLYSWERLVNKCLVELDNDNCIKMHDHLRDLGREIANTQSPCRLWSPNQITTIQKQDQIRGMILNAANKEVHKLPDFLLNTRGPFLCFPSRTTRPFSLEIKVFLFEGDHRDKLPIAKFSRKLAWLSCTEIADRNLPLRVLELHDCGKLKGLWKDGPEAPKQLRVLIVDHCSKLRRIPKSIKLLKNLKQMSLIRSDNLKGLPEQFCCLESLEHLQLVWCRNLSSLPGCFGELRNLRHLNLSYSLELRMLPDSFKQLKLLQHLNLSGCSRLAIQRDIMENMTKLEYLNFNGCGDLKELPTHITNQINLRELYSECHSLRKLPMDIGQLSKLRVMKIASQVLPESFWDLNH